jgi:RND family efflux transporter MFP subunit
VSEENRKSGKAEKKTGRKRKLKAWHIVTILAGLCIAALVVISIINVVSMPKGVSVSVARALKGNIVQTVDTSGPVESEESKTYFADVSAVIASLPVKAGQTVKAGELLVSYDTAELEKTLEQVQLETKINSLGADAAVIGIDSTQQKVAEAAQNYDEAEKYVAHYSDCVAQINAQLTEAAQLTEKQQKLTAQVQELSETLEKDPADKKTKKSLEKTKKELSKVTKSLDDYDVNALNSALEVCSGDLAEYKAQLEQYKAEKEAADPAASTTKAQQAAVKESAQLGEQSAEEELAKAKEGVKADFDGIVSEVSAVEGQTITQGSPLFTIQNENALKVTLSLSKYDVEKISIGQKAKITINGKEYTGTVSAISRVATTNAAGSAVIAADVHIDDPDDTVILGLEAKVSIETAEEEGALLVPASSVNYASDGVFCYIVEDGKLARRQITTGISDDTYIQVLSGLEEGDAVVTSVTSELTEGLAVIPIEEDSMAGTEDLDQTEQSDSADAE